MNRRATVTGIIRSNSIFGIYIRVNNYGSATIPFHYRRNTVNGIYTGEVKR